jgi:hypothetical protein
MIACFPAVHLLLYKIVLFLDVKYDKFRFEAIFRTILRLRIFEKPVFAYSQQNIKIRNVTIGFCYQNTYMLF